MSKNYLSIYAKSFNWAGYFLSKETYNDCSSLYDFCRTVDNIADNEDGLEHKKVELHKFKKKFYEKDFSSKKIESMWGLIDKFSISTKVIGDLFDGVETDLKDNVKIANRRELLIYSYRVAGTVGLMMAKVLKVNSREALKSAINLGIAMQLTNIARDVVEDRKKNRKYIEHNFKEIKETVAYAEKFYNSSFNSIKMIPILNRFAILVARRVYREIGNKIIKKKNLNEYDRSGKIFVTKFGKIIQTIFSVIDFFILLFVKSENQSENEEYSIINETINLDERF